MDSINWTSILTFLSGGVLGGFIGGASKFLWEKYLPERLTWQRQQATDRERVMSEVRGPAIRAMLGLERRIYGTLQEQGRGYESIKQEGHGDYYVNATTFQIAECCAWIEILRDKMGALDYADLETNLSNLSLTLLGDYRPHFHVFLLEQREIGERMTSIINGEICCKGYSEFLDIMKGPDAPGCLTILRSRVTTLLDDWCPEAEKLIRIQHALINMVNFLDEKGRWITKARRSQGLDAAQVIENLLNKQKLTEDQAKELRRQARNDGLMDRDLTSGDRSL